MTQNLKRIKEIGNHDKLPVFGYIRKSQNELTFLTIPMLIYYLCLAIASHERDVGTNEHPVYDIGFEFKQDDILTIALNTRERRFKVTNNGKMKIVRYLIKVGPAIKYKLCIKSDSVGNSVSLLDFSSDTIPI